MTRIATEPSSRAATAARPPGDLAALAARHGLTASGTRPTTRPPGSPPSTARRGTECSVYTDGQPTLPGVNAAVMNDVTGERNVVLGCLASGMSRAEVKEPFDAIVAFSGIKRQRRVSCERAIWLEQGLILADGETDDVIDAYEARHDPKALAERLSAACGLAAARGCG